MTSAVNSIEELARSSTSILENSDSDDPVRRFSTFTVRSCLKKPDRDQQADASIIYTAAIANFVPTAARLNPANSVVCAH
jgi:hypothetical protein